MLIIQCICGRWDRFCGFCVLCPAPRDVICTRRRRARRSVKPSGGMWPEACTSGSGELLAFCGCGSCAVCMQRCVARTLSGRLPMSSRKGALCLTCRGRRIGHGRFVVLLLGSVWLGALLGCAVPLGFLARRGCSKAILQHCCRCCVFLSFVQVGMFT